VTAANLAIETFLPTDEESAAKLAALAALPERTTTAVLPSESTGA
jgi:hypothetical protein